MLFSRCQLRSTCITVYQLSFSIVLLFLEPINSMTRFIFLSSFLLIERNMRYYLFPRISFFFGCETVATRALRVRIRTFWGETSHFAWNSFSGRALFTGFAHNWCGARAFNVCHVVDRGSPFSYKFPAIQYNNRMIYQRTDLSFSGNRVIRYLLSACFFINRFIPLTTFFL